MRKLSPKRLRLQRCLGLRILITLSCQAMVAERAIFFVLLPFFRANGDAGMRTVSADIS